jgi:hypothetical protein
MQLAQPAGAQAQQFPSKLFRSAEGKLRVDTGNMSVITDLQAKQSVILDHLTKEARISSMQPPLGPDGLPLPNFPTIPEIPGPPPPMNVKDLGKRFIEGHEVEGKEYIIQKVPKVPGLQLPNAPQPPPITSEVWTSTKLQLPVLTRLKGSFGEQLCHCRVTEMVAPNPQMFQIPPDYKVVPMPQAAPPSPPAMPQAPTAPTAPAAPQLPQAPKLPKF